MRILVVEDDRKVANFIQSGLSEEGYAVDVLYEGSHAGEQAHAFDYDAVVLDLMLPLMDGYDVLEQLQADERTRTIPVLVLTAKAQREDRVRCWEQGASGYMTKPFSPVALSAALTDLLGMSPMQREDRRNDMLRKLRDESPSWR